MSKPLTKLEWEASVNEAWAAAIQETYKAEIEAAVLAEREACAMEVKEQAGRWALPFTSHDYNLMWRECAAAIRARGKTK